MQIVLEVLGEVRWQGAPITGERPRALLRALVAAGPAGAGADALAREIWGDEPPAHPRKALQVLVSRVRAATDPRVIAAAPDGYRIGLDRAEVDSTAADELAGRAAALLAGGDAAAALTAAGEALGIAADPGARRTAALARARLGAHAAALDGLAAVLEADPWDEEVLAAALRAESATHGPAAALARYERYRVAAAERLGTGPGAAVQAVYRELLGADAPVRAGLTHTATALIGRGEAVTAVTALAATYRLVSIVGVGGLGKTRLAQEVAAGDRAAAVYFVELAPVTTAAQILPAIAAVCEVRDRITDRTETPAGGPDRLRAQVTERLRRAPTLLVLDNCEHLADPVADLVAILLAHVADLRILTTSRTPLGLADEQVYPLTPLDSGAAAELLVRRARARRPSVVLDPGEVDALVRLLDGLPLAIELAAAQVRVLSIGQIIAAMTDRFALLQTADRSAPARHRTLAAVIDWSYRLLTAPARDGLRALSVLRDGFTADHARALLTAAGLPGVGAAPVPAAVTELVDQSLLVVEEDAAAVRYRMLATVREYAAGQARDHGETERWRAAKTAWARALAREATALLLGPELPAGAAAVRGAASDLVEVFDHACRGGDPATALDLFGVLGPYWFLSGSRIRLPAAVGPVEDVIADWSPGPEQVPAARLALSMLAVFGVMSPLHDRLGQTRRILTALGPDARPGFTDALSTVARALLAAGPAAQADRLAALTGGADRSTALIAGMLLAGVQENAGRPRAALGTARTALGRVRGSDGPWPGTFLRVLIAQLHCQLGVFAAAAEHAEAALGLLETIGADTDVAQCRVIIAIAALDRGALDVAAGQVRAARALPGAADTSAAMTADLVEAHIALARGDMAGAADLVARALARRGRDVEGGRAGLFGGSDSDPWILLGEATALALLSGLPGAEDAAQSVADRLGARVARALRPELARHDFPVLGTTLFALGLWRLHGPRAAPAAAVAADAGADTVAAQLWALAEAFAYNRFLPALAWERATAALGEAGRAALTREQAALAGRTGADLLTRAGAAVAQRSR